MTVISESVKDMNGYKLHIVKTPKFKTNTLVWKMKSPLKKEVVTTTGAAPLCFAKQFEKLSLNCDASFVLR